jgi:hypothetical protein
MRCDENGTPIIDQPLCSPVRLIGAYLRWWMYVKADDPHGSLWFCLRWHRRGYEAYVKRITWMY